jgi:hypothetical protein
VVPSFLDHLSYLAAFRFFCKQLKTKASQAVPLGAFGHFFKLHFAAHSILCHTLPMWEILILL